MVEVVSGAREDNHAVRAAGVGVDTRSALVFPGHYQSLGLYHTVKDRSFHHFAEQIINQGDSW